MSEKINPEDQDSNEPIKHSHYSSGVPTGREFEHLYNRYEKTEEKLDSLVGKVDKICLHIESQEKAKKTMYRNIGIITGAINAIVLMILNGWKVVSGN